MRHVLPGPRACHHISAHINFWSHGGSDGVSCNSALDVPRLPNLSRHNDRRRTVAYRHHSRRLSNASLFRINENIYG